MGLRQAHLLDLLSDAMGRKLSFDSSAVIVNILCATGGGWVGIGT